MEVPKANIEFLQNLKSIDDFIYERASEISQIIQEHERFFKMDPKKLSDTEREAIAKAHARMIFLFMQIKPGINLFVGHSEELKELNHGMHRMMQPYNLFPQSLSPHDIAHKFNWESEEGFLSTIKKFLRIGE